MVGRETGKRRVARLLTGDVASASHVMMGRVHSHARIALLAGPRAAGPVKRVAYLSLVPSVLLRRTCIQYRSVR